MTVIPHTCTREQADEITGRFRDALGRVETAWNVMVATAIDAFANRVWIPLGYRTWDEYCAQEVDTAAVRIPRDLRIQIVGQMSASGMSARAIAPAIGVADMTVGRDLESGATNVAPGVPALDETTSPEDVAEEFGIDLDEDDDPALTQEECEALDNSDREEMLTDAELAREAEATEVEVIQPRIIGTDGKSYPKPEPKTPRRPSLTDSFWRATYDLGKKVTTVANLASDDRFKRNADQLRQESLPDLIRARDALQCVIDQLTN